MREIIASRGHAHLVAALLLAGGLNLLPQAFGLFAFTTRAFLNLDYFLIAAATLLLGPHVLRLAVPAVLALDLLFSLAPAWHFQMGAALQSLADLVLLPAYFWLPIAAVLLAVIFLVSEGVFRLWCNVLPPRSQRRAMAAGAVLALGGGVAMADKIFEVSDDSGWSAGGGVNLAGSGLSDLRTALRTAEAEEAIVLEDAEAASAEITAALGGGSDAPSNVILIAVESWGSGVDQALDALVIEPLVRAADKIPGARLRQGRVPFAGSTVPGEIRELCGRKVLTTRPRLERIVDDCLPRLLKRQGGYTTLAVHGFAPAMFSRNAWYQELGFDTIAFAPELTKAGARERCGVAFPGICDREAWQWIANEIRAPGRHFVYWLTLSAHLPLPRSPAWRAPDESRCRTTNVTGAVCDLLLVHRALFEALAESAIGGDLADTLIVAVGDHSPPFLQASSRALFESGHVPFVSLRLPAERGESRQMPP